MDVTIQLKLLLQQPLHVLLARQQLLQRHANVHHHLPPTNAVLTDIVTMVPVMILRKQQHQQPLHVLLARQTVLQRHANVHLHLPPTNV